MTTAVMSADQSSLEAARPIVLTINCESAQRYLDPRNELLAVLGASVDRIDITMSKAFAFPRSVTDPHSTNYDHQAFHDALDDIVNRSPVELRESFAKPDWVRQFAGQVLWRKVADVYRQPVIRVERSNVKIVLVNKVFVLGEPHVRDAVQELFPSAAYFGAGDSGVPTRIWVKPTCPFGHGVMAFDTSLKIYRCETCRYMHGSPIPTARCRNCEKPMVFEEGRHVCRDCHLEFRWPDQWNAIGMS